ncbi:MAG: hypothetical protein IPH44_43125 [Myxococcales bacterium]|jgi:tetratricopeptide (TPR) repeat protein|nr:hypothetical protein [Myxococcales bacterium]MBK7192808.1 hypothetical protein [Myxococcales bacterium]
MSLSRISIVIATLAAGSPAVLAEPAPAAAEAHRQRGIALYQTQRYEEAIAEFTAGYEVEPRPVFLFNIAQARKQVGDCRAVQAFRRFLAAVELLPVDAPARREVEDGIPFARANLERLAAGCATAMSLPTRSRARRWTERPAVIATIAGGALVAGAGAGMLALGDRAARAAHAATTLADADAELADARAWRIGGGAAIGAGVVLAAGAYWLHRRYPSFVDEVTVEVDDAGATARVGGRF